MLELASAMRRGCWVAYETTLYGRSVARSWVVSQGALRDPASGADVHELRFWQEYDALGLGPRERAIRSVGMLQCAAEGQPLQYRLVTGGVAAFHMSFDDGEAIAWAHDGTRLEASCDGADFLLAANMPAQLAVFVRLLERGDLPYRGGFFAPEALQVVPYELVPEAGRLQSSLDEHIVVGDDGWMRRLDASERGLVVERSARRPPAWRRTAPLARRRVAPYRAPPGVRSLGRSFSSGGVTVGATLAVPRRGRPFARAVFVAGSGTHDRHGLAGTADLGYHQLLDRLARDGIATLRYDKRGAGSTPLGADVMSRGFGAIIDDARAGLAALRRERRLRGLPTLAIGHCEGGLVALELAAAEPLNGVVLLGTPARTIDAVMADQIVTSGAALDLDAAARESWLARLERLFEAVRDVPEWNRDTVPARVLALKPFRRYYAELLERDPLELVARVRCPLLVLHGGRDEQIRPTDAETLAAAARAAGVRVEVRVLPQLDHLLKRAPDRGSPPAGEDRRRRVSSEVAQRVERWTHGLLNTPEV